MSDELTSLPSLRVEVRDANGTVRSYPVSRYLGDLVEAQLNRRGGTPVAGLAVDMPEPDQAVAALAEVRRSIDELDQIAGRLARSAVSHGAPWADVASSLRLQQPENARRAYGRSPA